jgi:hypothetical protein
MWITFEFVADAVKAKALGRATYEQEEWLKAIGFATGGGSLGEKVELSARGEQFDEAWNVYGQKNVAVSLLREGLLELATTQALVQALHGRGDVSFGGALHVLAKLGLADPDASDWFRQLLLTLDEFEIVDFSKTDETVRVTVEMPSGPRDEAEESTVKIITPDRPYQNIRHLREILRDCRGYIWWADPHFSKQAFEPLADEADKTKITEIKILSATKPEPSAVKDYLRFSEEMKTLGITVEWRSVPPPDRDWHDRFIITRGKAWNVPPVGAIFKGSYSEFTATVITPPFERWWADGTPVT